MTRPPDSPESPGVGRRLDRLSEQLTRVLGEVQELAQEVEALRQAVGEDGEAPEQPPVPAEASQTSSTADSAAEPAELPAQGSSEELIEEPAAAGTSRKERLLAAARRVRDLVPVPADSAVVGDEAAAERSEDGAVVAGEELVAPPESSVEDSAGDDGAESEPLDLEQRIGAVWFLRGGLLFVVIAFALAASWVVPQLQPWHRVLASYVGSAVVFGVGLRYAGRLRRFARPVMATGLALGFFTSFGAYFLPPMRCLPLVASLVLMTLFVGAILASAERWRWEGVATLALFLGHVAAYVGSADADIFSMMAVLFLSATSVVLMLRHDWMPLALFSVIMAYSSHFLWTMREAGPAGVGEVGFVQHLSFLTAYYLLYLVADAAFTHRLEGRGREAFSRRQRVTGRSVGPTAMVLYATLAAALFQSSPGAWERIHWFFLPLALVQLLLLILHHRKGTADVPLYVTAATVFATLALFSRLGGLALNMALAAEALLLLVLGRVIEFGFLRHLARVVLVVNFVSFWFSEAKELDSWPTFVGALLMAAVYFVRARQNETWEPLPPEQRLGEAGAWSLVWHRLFRPLTVPLAHGQTLSGAILVVYQCDKFLGPPWNVVALALLAAGGALAGLWLGSAPLLQGMFWLQLATGLLLWREASGWEAAAREPSDWLVHQLAVALLATIALLSMALAARRRRAYQRFAAAGLGSALLAGFAAGAPALAPANTAAGFAPLGFGALALALVPLALVWACLEIWPRPAPEALAQPLWQRRSIRDRRWRTLFAVLVAELGVWALLHGSAGAFEGVAALAVVTVLLGLASLWRGTPYLLLGLLVHLGATGALALGYLDATEPAHSLLRWVILTEAGVLAALLLTVCPRCRRGSFALGALACFGLAVVMMAWLAVLPDQRFEPLWPWGLTAAVLMVVVELFRTSPARRAEDFDTWVDRWGETALRLYARPLAALGAVLTSAVFGLIIGRACTYNREALWAMAVTSALLLVATILRNSPYLMAALLTQLGLMGAYRILYGSELIQRPMTEWASVTLILLSAALLMATAPWLRRASLAWGSLVALTVGLVGMGELLFNQRPGPTPTSLWLITFVLLWVTVEALHRGFSGQGPEAEGWLDTFDLEPLTRRAMALAVISSMTGAVLLIALTWLQFPSAVFMIFVTVLYAVLFVVLTAWLKSPPMAAAFSVCLTAAHPLFYGRVGAEAAVGTAPQLALLMLAVTVAAGAAVEWSFRHHDETGRRRPAWWAAWYAYLLGFGLAGIFLQPFGEELAGARPFGAPAQSALALIMVGVGCTFKLRWLIRAAVLFALICSGLFIGFAVFDAGYRESLGFAGVLLLGTLLLSERLLVGQEPEELCRSAPAVGRFYRRVLVAVAALVGLVGLTLGPELAGVWTTAGWSLLALVLIGLGFLWRDRIYRRTALAVFALAILRLAILDVTRLETYYQMLAFLCLGASMVAVSFLYSRYREHITRWL
ncbi:MAG: DUF2339 domain-containing protein [Acidobacteriota bacterium]|nr:DUF2339 domain-containing protein [Acidobacteriota bacterium]